MGRLRSGYLQDRAYTNLQKKKKKKKTIREGAKNALRHTHTNEKVQSYMDLQFSSLGEKTRENRCLIGAEKKGCDMRH